MIFFFLLLVVNAIYMKFSFYLYDLQISTIGNVFLQ